MAAKSRNDLKAGIFIIVSIGLIMTVIFSIRGIGGLFDPDQRRTVAFRLTDDLGGLRVGDDVRLGGFKIGNVVSIRVARDVATAAPAPAAAPPTTEPSTRPAAPDDGTRLLVTIRMPARYDLREDARIAIQSTITGTTSLNIDQLGTGRPLPDGVALVGRPSPMTALLAALGELSPELTPTVRSVRGTVDDVRGRILPEVRGAVADARGQLLPKVGEAVTNFKDAGGHLRDLLGDTKTDFRTTIANVKDATGTVKEKLPGTMDEAKALLVRLNATVENTKGTLEDVKVAVANVKDITGTGREVVSGNRSKLDQMIASLKTTGDNLKAASSEIRRSPWRLLYKPGKGEVANLNLYDSARQFAEGAGSLQDSAAALRDALKSGKADPQQVERLLKKLENSFLHFRDVEDKLWSGVQE
jgi:ABC-type transporter Mla subunit MlaD